MNRNRDITIGDTVVRPGTRADIMLPVADLYTSTSLGMPVQVISGRKEGPVLFVSAAIHGDELNGVEIIRRLLKRKIMRSVRGTLIAVPIVNVHGFLDQSRYLPDRRDLNRSFPGSAKGVGRRRALRYLFMREIVSRSRVRHRPAHGAPDAPGQPAADSRRPGRRDDTAASCEIAFGAAGGHRLARA